jgi:hypothetical protein
VKSNKTKTAEPRRGQQTGFAGHKDRNRTEVETTPAVRGKAKHFNKMFGDVSEQHTGSDVVSPSTNSPSTPGMKTASQNELGAEAVFKRRLEKKRQESK